MVTRAESTVQSYWRAELREERVVSNRGAVEARLHPPRVLLGPTEQPNVLRMDGQARRIEGRPRRRPARGRRRRGAVPAGLDRRGEGSEARGQRRGADSVRGRAAGLAQEIREPS